ncbi:MAG TPA: methyltransferase domain-containing protein [Gemmatales bacterium]|nr:methyltransferase domain-containing protein [Gemmatales bacterium]
MSQQDERDYVLGTHQAEVERLGIQHRVWRPMVLDCWRQAGITTGSKVLDVGAGPGYATVDLAEIVGPTGEVWALERSQRFLQSARQTCEHRQLHQVHYHEADLMVDPLPVQGMDATWCRWVACFVSSPKILIEKLAGALRPGGVAIFHEYVDYGTWQLLPPRPLQTEFVRQVMASWRQNGGEPDIARQLPTLLIDCGLRVIQTTPRVFCVKPDNYLWQWPASFMETGLTRLVELKLVAAEQAVATRQEFHEAEANPATLMVTPVVLEIVAVKG